MISRLMICIIAHIIAILKTCTQGKPFKMLSCCKIKASGVSEEEALLNLKLTLNFNFRIIFRKNTSKRVKLVVNYIIISLRQCNVIILHKMT